MERRYWLLFNSAYVTKASTKSFPESADGSPQNPPNLSPDQVLESNSALWFQANLPAMPRLLYKDQL